MDWIKGNGLSVYVKVLSMAFLAMLCLGVDNLYGDNYTSNVTQQNTHGGATHDATITIPNSGKPYYLGGKWYSIYYDSTSTNIPLDRGIYTMIGGIYPPCANYLTLSLANVYNSTFKTSTSDIDTSLSAKESAFAMGHNDKMSYDTGWGTASGYLKGWAARTDFRTSEYTGNKNVPKWKYYNIDLDSCASSCAVSSFSLNSLTEIDFYNRSGANIAIKNFWIELANHIRFNDGSTNGTANMTVACATSVNGSKTITIPLRSFLLANGKITIKKRNGGSSAYSIGSPYTYDQTNDEYYVQIVQNQNVVCGVAGETSGNYISTVGNASTYNVVITFNPSSSGIQNAIYDVYDGDTTGTPSATITLNGTSVNSVGDNNGYQSDNPISNGNPYYINGKWYSLYQGSGLFAIGRGTFPTFTVYPPCKNTLYLSLAKVYYNSTAANHSDSPHTDDNPQHFAIGETNKITGDPDATDYIYGWKIHTEFASLNYNAWKDYSINMQSSASSNNTTLDTLSITGLKFHNRAAVNMIASNMQIELAEHIYFTNGKNDTTINKTGTATGITDTIHINVPFRSFHLKNGKMTIKMKEGDPDVFRFNGSHVGTIDEDGVVLHDFNSNGAPVCGVAGEKRGSFTGANNRAGDAYKLNFNIVYYPSSTQEETAVFELYDGDATGTPLATFTVKAKGADVSGDIVCTGQKPEYGVAYGGTYRWFSLYVHKEITKGSGSTADNYSIFSPCSKSAGCRVMYRSSSNAGLNPGIKLTFDVPNANSYTAERYSNGTDYRWAGKDDDVIPVNYAELNSVSVERLSGGGLYSVSYNNLQIELAKHVRLYDASNANGITTKEDKLSTVAHDTVKVTVALRSFLTEKNLKLKVVDKKGDASKLFKIWSVGGTKVDSTDYTVTEYANICGYRDGTSTTVFDKPSVSINTESLDVVIEYIPTCASVAGGDSAVLVFYDGENVRATDTLIGTATAPSMSVVNTTMDCHSQQKLTIDPNNSESYTIDLSVDNENVVEFSIVTGITSSDLDKLTITAKDEGEVNITATISKTDNVIEQKCSLTVKVVKSTMKFKGQNGSNTDWFTAANWYTSEGVTIVEVPDKDDDVEIDAKCLISSSTQNATCNNLTFQEGTDTLVVDSMSTLVASGSITTKGNGNLYLRANANKSASVLFASAGDSNSPKATVECWFRGKSTKKSETESNIMIPQWQYRGFIGNPDKTKRSESSDMYIWLIKDVLYYKWLETNNGKSDKSNCWDEENPNKNPAAWDGFSMANVAETCTTQVYTTTLIPTANATHQFTMTKSGSKTTSGLNLFTNSYSAPVKIAYITFDNSVANNEIVLFNTMSYQEVVDARKDEQKKSSIYVTCPSSTATTLGITHIPAGGSFFCFTTVGDEHITIKPDTAASGKMLAPRKDNFNVLKIYAESETERDEVYLVESDNCTHNYDNGYDGTKYFTSGMGQIYGKNEFGRTFIAADSSMLGQMIGFRAGSNDMTYTLRFDIDRLSGYDELYLYDRVTKRYVNILEGGTYEFNGTTEGEDERFQVIGRMEDSDSFITGSDHAIEVVGERALLRGFDGEDEVVYMTDLAGKVVWSDNAKNGPWFELPTNIASGLYVIHCGDVTGKYLKR